MNTDISRFPIKIEAEDIGKVEGELVRFLAPRTVGLLLKNLPIEGRAALQPKEIYFEVPVIIGHEKSIKIADKGTIAYWPMGKSLCIFLDKVITYSNVTPIGRIVKNLSALNQVKSGTKITVERI